MRSLTRPLAAIAALATMAAVPASAGDFSVRAGAYTDESRFFIGAEYRAFIQGHIAVAPNLEVVIPEEGSYFSFSADLHYVFPTQGPLAAWLGAGLGVYARSHEGGNSQTHVGLNLIGGLGLKTKLKPYMQLKVVVKDDTALVLGFGIRF
ncbi:MAG TPA: hypothetical protein VEQ10_09605 [Vicinamibacteria bacterium]|nr:hypothetical protein [Vicinamibacteria bacterium]